jgi:hypothetical protein
MSIGCIDLFSNTLASNKKAEFNIIEFNLITTNNNQPKLFLFKLMFSKVETSLLPLYQYQMKFDVSPIMVTGN